MRASRTGIVAGLAVGLVMTAGCGSGGSGSSVDPQRSRLRSVVSQYVFATQRLGHRPANEEEFKAFINKEGAAILQDRKLASADELLTSERDGEPFVIMYGKPGKGVSPELVGYEKTGVDGRRLAGFSMGNVAEIDEARLKELVPNAPAP